MANKGLKEYTKQISQTIGDVAKVSVNVNKEDANMHIIIPLIQTLGPNPIDLSLIYNYQDREKQCYFGKGCRLSTFKHIIEYAYSVDVEDADGSIVTYEDDGNENYYSKESPLEVSKSWISIPGDGDYATFSILDQQGNSLHFDENSSHYPASINYKNGFETTLSGPDMDNGYGAKVTFTKTSNYMYSRATYTQDGTNLYYVDFGYDSEQRLTSVKHYKESILVKHLSISYGLNEITVKDEILKDYAKYTFTNNCVTKITEVLNDNASNAVETSISYEDRRTTLTDNDGRKVYVYFDNNNFPLFEIDEDGNAIETKYNETTKKLTSQSSTIPTKKKLNNLCSITIGDFSKDSGISTSVVSVTDSVLSGVLGTVYRVSGTGSLRYTLSTQGLGNDTITAVLWGKQLTAYSSSSNVTVELRVDGFTSDEFKKKTIDNNFDMMTLGVTALKSYSSITLTISLKGNASIEIGGIQVLKKDYGTSFVYDEYGNIIEAVSSNGGITRTYDSTGLQTASIGKNSAVYCYDYDDKGRMTSARTAYGGKVEYIYEKNNNINRTIISNFNSTKKLETINTYDSNGSFVETITDELLNVTHYEYDFYGRLKKIINALSETTEFNYDTFDNLTKILFDNSISATYDYDSQNKITKATLSNGTVYSFGYDTSNNLNSVSINGVVIVSFTYDSKTGLIKNQKYGASGDSFDFVYNAKHNIKEIKINNALKYQYEYDEFDRLVKVKDENGADLKSYSYNNDGRITKVSENGNTIEYSYDGAGNICQKKRTSASKTIYESIDSASKSTGFSPDNVIGYVQGSSEFLGTIFNRNSDLRNRSYVCKALNYKTGKESDLIYVKKDGVSCVYCGLTEPMCYMPPKVASGYDNAGSIGFWFYPISFPTTYYSKKYLFSIRHRSFKSCIAVYINNSGHLVLEAWDINGTAEIKEFNSNITLNQWNFFGLNFSFRNDGEYYAPVLDYELYHNDNCLKGSIMNKQYLTGNAPYHIGYRYDNSEGCLELNCYITTLMIKNGNTITQDKMYEYYSVTKDYIKGAANLKDNSVNFGIASTHNLSENMLNQFDIFPLHSHAKSLKGTEPSIYNVRRVSHEDRDRTYQFNNQIKRFAYVADEVGRVEYSLEGFSTGTILMRACINTDANTSQFFLQLEDYNGQTISLFRASNKYLFIGINGVNTQTDFYLETKKWYTVGISFMEGAGSISLGADCSINVRVYLDGKTFSIEKGITNTYTQVKLSLGKLFTSNSSAIIDKNCHPLLGQIEMLAIRAAYCEVSTLDALSKELKDTTKISEYDELGMLQKKTIDYQETDILCNSYSYEMRSATEAFTSNRIQTETIKYGSSTVNRSYVYDDLNRITEIKDSVFGSHTYMYNTRGFLTQDNSMIYDYDSNGNITKAGSTTFSYNSTIKDRLEKVNNIEIKYEGSNPLNPSSWNGNTYTFEGRRLTKCNDIEYTYNDQGLRTSKEVDGNITTYYYDGDQLITEVAPNSTYRLDFLYDENNQLYGFIYNNSDKYYYIRDFMQNILGIIDTSGNLVVKYEYTAYGTITSITGSLASTIGAYNPFRYKGYYYDTETNMCYCKSRYYVPEWCRWLNADSIEYLDPTNINGMNLFAYCNNSPVMGIDPTGHFGIGLTLLIATGVGLAFGFGIETAKQAYNGGEWNWNLSTWNWWEIGKASLIGAATGFAYGLGGVAGGIVKGSFQALTIARIVLTVSQSVGLLLGTAAVTNFAAGVAGYAMHTAGSETENFNILKGISEGIGQTGKGILSFFTAGMYVGFGFWKVGVGAKNTFSSILGRTAGRFVANYVPNYMFENLF